MTVIYLVRHGETDYSNSGTKIYRDFGENFAPLTEKGIDQITHTASDKRLGNANIIVSSPYTRTMQSAAILSRLLQLDLVVDPDIYEWVADLNWVPQEKQENERRCKEFNELNGIYPEKQVRPWESNEMLQNRLTAALQKYKHHASVVVVCHGMLMHSVCSDHWAENGEIVELILQ